MTIAVSAGGIGSCAISGTIGSTGASTTGASINGGLCSLVLSVIISAPIQVIISAYK